MKTERLKEIMKIAKDLGWIANSTATYPLMQISEVEKCMLAMVDDEQLEQMRRWLKDKQEKEYEKNRPKPSQSFPLDFQGTASGDVF